MWAASPAGRGRGLLALALCACAAAGCRQILDGLRGDTQPRALKSWDGAFQVTTPSGWRTDRDLHEKADLAVSRRIDECYVVVLSESKADFADMDVERHSETTLKKLTGGLGSVKVGPVQRLTIAGQPALQYEVAGTSDNLNVRYLHTTVELGGYYHQILAWTLVSRWERVQATLRAVVASFAPARAPATPAPSS